MKKKKKKLRQIPRGGNAGVKTGTRQRIWGPVTQYFGIGFLLDETRYYRVVLEDEEEKKNVELPPAGFWYTR